MYKHSGLVVIAALVISSMGILAPATTVTAYTNQPTVGITETSVRDNAYVFITLTVSNPSGGENVENVLIVCENAVFTAPMGLQENVAENWDNIADNLIKAGQELAKVADNLEYAAQNLQDAADALIYAASYIDDVGEELRQAKVSGAENIGNAGSILKNEAPQYLDTAGDELKATPISFDNVRDNLFAFAAKVRLADADLRSLGNPHWVMRAGENLNYGDNRIENAADNLGTGIIRAAAIDLENAAAAFENAGKALGNCGDNELGYYEIETAGNYLENYVAAGLRRAAENLKRAADNLDNAGYRLGVIKTSYLDNADNMLARASRLTTSTTHFLAPHFFDNIGVAATELESGITENIFQAAENLKAAATEQTVDYWLGPNLASNLIGWYGEVLKNTVRYYIGEVGQAMENENINLTTAASMLDNAASKLIAAGNKIKATAALLEPTIGWGMETGGVAGTNGVLFTAMTADNCLTAGNDMTFKFLWRAPDISTDKEYTFSIYSYKMDNTCSDPTTDTVTVSGQEPYVVSFVAQQTGATTTNIVGRVLDNGKFTLTLTANEAISSIGSVYIDNVNLHSATFVNLLGPLTLTSTDNIIWTLEVDTTIDTTSWEDNWENLRVRVDAPWGIDADGLENTDNAFIDNLTFDVIKPRFVDNSLTVWQALPVSVKPGTTENYFVTTVEKRVITGEARDYYRGVENVKIVTTEFYVNDSPITLTHDPDYKFTGEVTLVAGVNTVSVRATDRVGNYAENALDDNIFMDNTKPTITFVSVGGVDWTDNQVHINDNTPSIRLRISDSGWGIPRENVKVWLCENTVAYDEYGATENLENSLVWDNGAATTGYNWENTYENVVSGVIKGLTTGWWYIGVEVNDNLRGGANEEENENAFMRFYVDVTAPPWTVTTAKAAITFYYQTTMDILDLITMTKIDSWYIEGQAQEAGSTIKLYVDNTVTTATSSTTADVTTGLYDYSLTVQLSEGIHAIYFQEIDNSGNESNKVLLGTYTVDKTVPVITLSAPADATTTDAAQITVSGTIVDYMGTLAGVAYDELTVTIDCTGAAVEKTVYLNADGSFSTTVPLVEGSNVINVVARDSATITTLTGNQTITTRTVTRTVTPWATYAIIVVIVALILAAIAIFRKR